MAAREVNRNERGRRLGAPTLATFLTCALASTVLAEPAALPSIEEHHVDPAGAVPPAAVDDVAPTPIGDFVPLRQATVRKDAPRVAAVVPQAIPRESQAPRPSTLEGGATARPAVEIVQKIPPTVRHGEPTSAEILVRNVGGAPLTAVEIVGQLGPNVEILESEPRPARDGGAAKWSLGPLGPEEHKTIQLRLVATASPEHPNFSFSTEVRIAAAVHSTAVVRKPELQLAVRGPERAPLGQPAAFLIELTNAGSTPVAGVVLRDNLPPGLSHPHGPDLVNQVGMLPPGETRRIKLTLTPTKVGRIVHRVSVAAEGLEAVERDVALEVEPPSLVLTSASPAVRFLHRPCPVEFKVTNKGDAPATNVKLVASLPEGVAFAHATAEGRHDPELHTVEWLLPEIGPGESRSLVLTGVAKALGEQVGRAMLVQGPKSKQETQWTTRIEGVAALQLEVTDVEDPVETGGETVLEIRVTNQGSIPATRVVVEVEVPAEIEPIAADGPSGQQFAERRLRFEPIAALAPKADLTYRIKAKAIKPGDHRFRVHVSSEQMSRPIVKEESTTVFGDGP